MKILIPKNLYSAILALNIPDEFKENIEIKPSSMISSELEAGNADVGLIPSCDLLKYTNFKVSKKVAISFDGLLSNAYLYFVPDQNKFDNIYLRGDVSSNEIILTKILFQERFEIEANIILDSNEIDFDENNYIIVGQENDNYVISKNGISFADQIAEFLNYPYVNYVLASKEESNLIKLNEHFDDIDRKIENEIFNYLSKIKLPKNLEDMVTENLDTIYYELTNNEIKGLNELLKLPYYHGIIKEITEVCYV